jgi:hypothetical protein
MIFETTAGEKIEYGPIALDELQLAQNVVIKEHRDRGEPIDPPTYEVYLELEDESEYHPHTLETIKEASDAEKAAWTAHLRAVEKMQDDIEAKRGLILLEAMEVELPEDDAWIKRRKRLFNEDVPEDKEERLLFYVNNVLLKTPADKNGLIEGIFDLSMSGAPDEVKQAYKDLFRGEMEVQGRAAAKFIKSFKGTDEEVVLQSLDAKRDGGQRVGDVAKSIPQTAGEG